MNLPRNGRVVVIDDDYKEALPLIKVLSKNNIPVIYLTGKLEELPQQQIENVRLIFLDMKLVSVTDQKTILSSLIAVLRRILSPENGPYILALWSKHENDYKQQMEFIYREINIRPVLMLCLEKATYLTSDNSGELTFVENALELIEDRLKEEIKRVGVFGIFTLWENLVHRSTGEIISNFSLLHPQDEAWNDSISSTFYLLAEAYSGKNLIKENVNEVIVNSLMTFNRTFFDILESNICDMDNPGNQVEIKPLKCKDMNVIAKINTKLLLEKNTKKILKPGNIYGLDVEQEKDKPYELKVYDILDPFTLYRIYAREHAINFDDLFDDDMKVKKDYKKNIDDFMHRIKEEVKPLTRCIFLEISPYCDYAQKKWKAYRILPGIIWPEEHMDKIKRTEYYYITPVFDMNERLCRFIFDSRYLTSFSMSEEFNKEIVMRIRPELLVDIQSHVARHINRPGVMSL